ncbi:redoxin domain-containing protein [Bacillus timonensis]|uniref:redoxin domain-containing protein n=1 Tax=Bacillus timonensis TaxID=1033734 RepID=UPI0002893094|nr:redoxin domain-containing protein [Bacillus timonensis]
MAQLQKGMQAPNFSFESPWVKTNTLSDVLEDKTTILVFLRYYGCPLCQLDIQTLAKGYEKFKENNAQVLVVLQTEASLLKDQIGENGMPLTLVCDPDHEIFTLYDVQPGKTQEDLASEEVFKKINIARDLGITKLENNGKQNELQLPATFIINPNGELEFVRYGTNAADIPSVTELLELIPVTK